jgi:16S rRNA processing protein RimM
VEKKGFLFIGKIVGVHGVKGNVKIYSYAESLSAFKPGSLLLLKHNKGWEKTYSIKWIKPHTRSILLSLKGINNRTQAEGLIGSELYIKKSSLPALEEGTYYWFDIIGLSVFTVAGEYIGRVESIMPTGSNDVFVVKDITKGHDKETLIPALESVVKSIDLKLKTMRVDLPEGLFD